MCRWTRNSARTAHFGLLSVQKPKKVPFLLTMGWPFLIWFTERIFKEDRDIVEMEQRAHDEQGGDWNQEVFPVIRDLRDVLAENGVPIVQSNSPSITSQKCPN